MSTVIDVPPPAVDPQVAFREQILREIREDAEAGNGCAPLIRSSRGLVHMSILAGKPPTKMDTSKPSTILKWCEDVRDHYADKMYYVRVSALQNLAMHHLADTRRTQEEARVQLIIACLFHRELKAEADFLANRVPDAVVHGERPKAGVVVEDETKKVTQGHKGGKRYSLWDHPVTGIIRWMGKNGWSADQCRKVLKHYNLDVADPTIAAQLRAGIKGERGDPAALNPQQIEEMTKGRDQ